MSFRATLQLHGRTATGIEVPDAEVEALGSGRQPAVEVTLNGYSYRSTVAVRGGVYLIPVSAEVRAAAGVSAGDEVDVTLVLDTAPRTVEVPEDLAAALADEPAARAFFDGLSPSKQKWFTTSVTGAKQEQTRRRRVETAVQLLREGRSR
ncbi:YdeI/OmpD-associated family protein [Angustibacter luteus]|uniref:YdeI/OmpD-associated family protein n=1 Tax=Angustibacter luteus TaxID=658456 RepID=A0ABW1JFA6_9ACTN